MISFDVFCLIQSASKEGYILNPVQGQKGHFKAVKLGQIEIKVYKLKPLLHGQIFFDKFYSVADPG